MSKQRITCCVCNKYFIITKPVPQVKCPECGGLNRLGEQAGAISSPVNLPPSPHYAFNEVSLVAKNLMEESPVNWLTIKVPYSGMSECLAKPYCLDKEKNEIFVSKAQTLIHGKSKDIFSVYWNEELEWDATTVATIKVMEDNGNERLLFKENKTTSAATLRNDVVVRQAYEQNGDNIWCYAVSDLSSVAERGGWRRGYVILHGFKIQPVDENTCSVSLIHCFDFGGWIHMKFVEEEQKRPALRLSKIKKKIEEATPAPVPAPSPVKTTAPRRTSVPASGPPVFAFGSGVQNVCPACKKTGSSVFCPNDGAMLVVGCAKCLHPVGQANFCGECGNKLV